MAFNAAWHESTGFTPALLFLGREMNHPLGLRWELTDDDLQRSPQDTHLYWELALGNLKKARDRVAKRYNESRREAEFKVGDIVLVKLHPQSSRAHHRSAKLDNKWSEPFVIAKFLAKVTVQLANPDTGILVRKAHVSQLKSYWVGELAMKCKLARIATYICVNMIVNSPPGDDIASAVNFLFVFQSSYSLLSHPFGSRVCETSSGPRQRRTSVVGKSVLRLCLQR
ncbi:hypothetical protein B7P43_G11730 [Cryptotermes secundus]|uniref:Uncharacterized protein n=1 Tax=Cryptotermes secundus TaxID=105785 RepID=A0A2J7PX01_9NEOP|nr:hypothetical protein B7P43_G11730 [Cryptotermes secundus]